MYAIRTFWIPTKVDFLFLILILIHFPNQKYFYQKNQFWHPVNPKEKQFPKNGTYVHMYMYSESMINCDCQKNITIYAINFERP